ncbi:hypothetical protein [Amycolatopsis sp. NPDC051061]|uniref:hypothetical protein n=1 Tax=Amycolatopsis sp. NPDC051061 TaxID=3155042 RepID=UPI003447C7A1
MDNPSANKTPQIRKWAAHNNVELCLTPTCTSWDNPDRGPVRAATHVHDKQLPPPDHSVLARRIQAYLRWRNANAQHPDILVAQRKERARIRSERQQRWGR